MPEGSGLIDSHCHLVVPDCPGSRHGFVSTRMRRSPLFRFVKWRFGMAATADTELAAAFVDRLRDQLRQSRSVRAAVVLALDGVYDAAGRLDQGRTQLYVANDTVLELAAAEPQFLAGASVNPARRDGLDELDRVAARGASLIKWLPNAQGFDPADPRFLPFYRRLAALRLPLLIHSGIEYSVVDAQFDAGGEPNRWQLALEEGVVVVAAHAGSCGRWIGAEEHLDTLLALVERHPNLYLDSSALGLPSRAGMLPHLLQHRQLRDRLTFGTDYPLPCFPSLALRRLAVAGWWAARRESNYFDRQVATFRAMGWEPSSAVLERLLSPRSAATMAVGANGSGPLDLNSAG